MFKKLFLAICLGSVLTGCMGHNALVKKVLKFNLKATQNRWGREVIFIFAFPVYAICSLIDNLFINSIEFWTGTNPLNGKSPVVDIPLEQLKSMNVPQDVVKAQLERLDSENAKLYLTFKNGDNATFDVVRNDMDVTISYQGQVFYKTHIIN
jgi:hypothetical protein